jgi:exodeoxyribonuclease V gamma subunit
LAPLPDAATDPIEIDQLVRFVQHPVRAFLRQRLSVSLYEQSEDAGDALPIELNSLEQWEVGHRLLDARLAGAGGAASVEAELARGILPPGALANPVIEAVAPTVDDLVAAAESLLPGAGPPGSVQLSLRLPNGRSLVGTVPDVTGNLLRAVTYSRVGPKHRLAAWVRLLALTAAYPDRSFEAATVGRGRGGSPVTIARIAAIDGDVAVRHLQALVDLYDQGMREPLPLYCATSAAYAEAAKGGRNPVVAGRDAWESGYTYDKEDKEPEHLLVLGGVRSFDQLFEAADDGKNGGPVDEGSRFGRLARRLWDDLLSCEELVRV